MITDSTTNPKPTVLGRPVEQKRLPLYSALITLCTLLGGLAIGIIGGSITHFGLPGNIDETIRIGISALPGLAGAFLGGILWGWFMARLVAPDQSRRMAWAGGLGFGPAFIVVALILTALEIILVEKKATDLPVHIVFTLLFVPAAAIIAASGSLALGVALRDRHLAVKLASNAGLTAGLAFLIVALLMDNLFGYRVGAPGAATRATMVTVLFVGIFVSTLVTGAVVGQLLSRHTTTG